MSPHQIQEIFFTVLKLFVFLGFPCLIIVGATVILIKIFKANRIETGGKTVEAITTVTTKVLSKRENLVLNPYGSITFYYIKFQDLSEIRVPEKIYKSTNAEDIVELTYEGENFINLSVIKKSGENSIPEFTSSGHFTDNRKSRE